MKKKAQTKTHIQPKISGPAKTFFGQKKVVRRPCLNC